MAPPQPISPKRKHKKDKKFKTKSANRLISAIFFYLYTVKLTQIKSPPPFTCQFKTVPPQKIHSTKQNRNNLRKERQNLLKEKKKKTTKLVIILILILQMAHHKSAESKCDRML